MARIGAMSPLQTIAHYRITAKLGEGGMGEVWRATDTKLGREVAIKILPDAFAVDAERLTRFHREAQILASLSHPNIAAIYGVEDRALVMELVEGPTLSGPMTVDEALPIAKQIAEGLEYAHEKGVIHRDLKPSNIKVTPEGRVKILDFGLAKALSGDGAAADTATSSTLTMQATMAGTILGTAAYMSPEQARGGAADKRSDIWSFGVVLYELLTGRQIFGGETMSDTLASVLKTDPDWSALPPEVPAALRRLLRRCLERDRKRCLRDIGDALVDIDEAGSKKPVAPQPGGTPVTRRPWLASACAGILLFSTLAFGTLYFHKGPPDRRTVQFDIYPPEGATFGAAGTTNFDIAPDSRKVAFTATGKDGRTLLYLRFLESHNAVHLTGTDGGTFPFWAPDSRWLGFFANGKLTKIDTTTGATQILCDVPAPHGDRDGVIVFASYGALMQKVSASGGVPSVVLPKEENQTNPDQRAPQFLPDGHHFLYRAFGEKPGIRIGSLDGSPPRFAMTQTGSPAFYTPPVDRGPGLLLFVARCNCWRSRSMQKRTNSSVLPYRLLHLWLRAGSSTRPRQVPCFSTYRRRHPHNWHGLIGTARA
jgi:serine/threonine protein kinase